MRTMYDSTNPADLPSHARMVAGYVDGAYANVDQLRRRFPGATVVTITVDGSHTADVVDRENGDVSVDGAVAWAQRMLDAHRHPTIYCSLADWPEVQRAARAAGIHRKLSWWIAHYDGRRVIPAGAVAVQYGDPTVTGHHFDISAAADYWQGVDDPRLAPLLRQRHRRRTARRLHHETHRRRPDLQTPRRRWCPRPAK